MSTKYLRCAVYTRKSSEEGLEQGFNSLDAQREAGEAYVKSQASEQWRLLPARYDDGGFSGGSMERPGLKDLLRDIEDGLIDVVVVYKIDRLTRSLADFARMVELFDRHTVSFVSVTQSFNTTSSMGRLTLNVLLSFAQFEREVTGERIRDKIAASKAKGMWMGGNLPLGFDAPTNGTRVLAVNGGEAETVRLIFSRYLELGSVHLLQRWLEQNGIRSKRWVTAKGKIMGDQVFSRGALFHLLRNETYLGRIVHGDKVYRGQHLAIVGIEMFDAVQARLDAQTRRSRGTSDRVARAALTGRIFDAGGQPMSPTFSHGARGQVYRYYVSAALQQGRQKAKGDDIARVPATAVESFLRELCERLVPQTPGDPLSIVTRIEVHPNGLHLLIPLKFRVTAQSHLLEDEHAKRDDADPKHLRIMIPVRMKMRGGRTWIVGRSAPASRRDPVLIKGLRSAHSLVEHENGLPRLDAAPASPYVTKLLKLAFLAPDIQEAILAGKQPPGLTLEQIMNAPMPLLWSEQRRHLGFH